jgi:esterase/lipase
MQIRQKLREVNWSNFLIELTLTFIFFSTVPHVLFYIPYWLQLPPLSLDLGWVLNGDIYLPSYYLSVFYALAGISFIAFIIVRFDYKFNRQIRKVKTDQVTLEKIEIPIGGGNSLVGDLLKSPITPKNNAPVLIMCHGLGSKKEMLHYLGYPMSFMGFAVLLYDSRGHGETKFGKKFDSLYIIRDLSNVIDYVKERAEGLGDLSKDDIFAFGISMGGGVVLNEGYLDHRVKFVIACCTWADYQMTATRKLKNLSERIVKAGYELQGINLTPSNLQNRLVSPILNSFNKKKGFFEQSVDWKVDNDYRVMLVHCKDDEFINYENFEINRDFLKMKPENYIVFDKGNHTLSGVETTLMGKMLLWLWQRGY